MAAHGYMGDIRPEIVSQAKQRSLVDLVSREIKLTRTGPEWVGLCPFHKERTPSFSVNETKGLYHCFGCGASGDIIDFTQHAYKLSFPEAIKHLAGDTDLGPLLVEPRSRPEKDGGRTQAAIALWRSCEPVVGSVAHAYLRKRGITIPIPDTLRFHGFLEHHTHLRLPAIVAAVALAPSRKVVAVHRTFLKPDGSGKTPSTKPRMMLGPCKGAAVRLAPWTGGTLAVAEGIETALSVMQMTGLTTWAALSDGGIEALALPEEIRDVLICADHDANGVGQTAARRAAERWIERGIRVEIVLPSVPDTDFNDLLRANATDLPAPFFATSRAGHSQ